MLLPLGLENCSPGFAKCLEPWTRSPSGGQCSRTEEERHFIPLGTEGGASDLQSSSESLASKLQPDWPPVPPAVTGLGGGSGLAGSLAELERSSAFPGRSFQSWVPRGPQEWNGALEFWGPEALSTLLLVGRLLIHSLPPFIFHGSGVEGTVVTRHSDKHTKPSPSFRDLNVHVSPRRSKALMHLLAPAPRVCETGSRPRREATRTARKGPVVLLTATPSEPSIVPVP